MMPQAQPQEQQPQLQSREAGSEQMGPLPKEGGPEPLRPQEQIGSPEAPRSSMSNIEKHTLTTQFNKMFDETIKKYLETTCKYTDTEKLESFKAALIAKYITQSKDNYQKGKMDVETYLNNVNSIFQCLYKRYNSGFFSGFFGHLPRLQRRIADLINKIVNNDGLVKDLSSSTVESICEQITKTVSGGAAGVGKKYKKTRKTKKSKSPSKKSKKSRSRKSISRKRKTRKSRK